MSMDFRPMADRWCRASFSVAGTDTHCRRDKGHDGHHSEVRHNADEDVSLRDGGPPDVLNDAMAGLVDRAESIDNRVAFYGLLHQVQLRINRVLRQAKKDGLVEEIVRDHPEGIGPVTVAWEAFDVEWPCNDEGNWDDAGVQEAMAVISLISPEYVRHIPDHFEINSAALGAGVHEGDPVARQLHTECKDRGWRTEGGRRAALKVREVKVPKGKAA